jgi:glycosyltransferase involved in cell wall biosynthesis
MPLISIIVPVYKTEKYLRGCVDSILAQTFVDFECILVNDGSPDGCPDICDEYARKDKRIKAIHQKNAGTAYARDAGIKASSGNFLAFVDSDDTVPHNAIKFLYEKLLETGADIVCGNIQFIYKKRKSVYKDYSGFTNPIEYVFTSLNNGLCGKIYKKELFDDSNLHIPELIHGEDLIINTQIFSRVNRGKIAFVDEVVYMYDRRTGGITTRSGYSPVECYLWMYDYLKKNGHFNDQHIKNMFLRRMIKDGILLYITTKRKIDQNEIKSFYDDYYRPCIVKSQIRFPERVIIPLYNFSNIIGYVYVLVFNLLKDVRLKIKGMY